MKKYILLSILSTFIASSLMASKLYIKVAALTHSDALFSLEYQLKAMGYKTYITQNDEWFRVYTGPFQDKREAQTALRKVQHKISKDAYITALEVQYESIVSRPLKVEPLEEEIAQQVQTQESLRPQTLQEPKNLEEERVSWQPLKQKSKELYVGFSAGASKFTIKKSGSLPLDISMRSYGPSYGLEAGYYFTPNIFSSLNYQKSELRHSSLDTVFVTLNYQLDQIGTLSPYAGVLGGVSKLGWSKNPVAASSGDLNLDSATVGLQLGGDIVLFGNLSTFMYYRYMSFDFNTLLSNGALDAEIEHNSQHDFNLGLKYKF